jgi:hypothetical protein
MFRPSRPFLAIALFFASAVGALAQAPPLASGQLEIRGNRLTLYADAASGATDARQTLNIGERGMVRTCFGGPGVPCGSVVAGDPRIAGLKVEAELSGPELPQPLVLTTVPGGSFLLPGFQQEGDYTLENIRLVSAESGQVIALAEPSLAILTVRQIVLTSATVRALTLAELRARGIEVTEENFQAFDFAVGFAFGTHVVEFEFPVTFAGPSSIGGLGKPQVKLDGLPAGVVAEVARWTPPMIVPFRLAPSAGQAQEGLQIGMEEPEDLVFPVYGVIVLPGTVTYLNQFFDASLLVANGAPAGSGAELRNLRAAIRLPGDNALRLARTEPPVSPGQDLPVLTENGSQSLGAGEKGKVSWTVEGLKAGTHSVFMDLQADLHRPGQEPMPVSSRSQAAVEVVDARFHLTFSHPDVVREGESYTLFVTVANESLAAQNLITVELKRQNLSGAHPASPSDDMRRTIPTLGPGQSETIEFELTSDTTGQVVATTFQAESNAGLGTIQLRAGVGELGIPLSPATLVLPRYSEHLKALAGAELMRANNRLLGLAYSLAVAPASALPPGLLGVAKTDVERRALDIGEAGQRIFLGDQLLPTLEVLALDQLGNRHEIEGYDQLRRQTSKGLRAGGELAKVLRAEQDRIGMTAEAFFEHFKNETSYASPFVAAVAFPTDSGSAVELEIRGRENAEGLAAFAGEDESRAVRTLAYAEVYRIRSEPGQEARPASFGLVGRAQPGQVFTVEIFNPEDGESQIRLLLMIPDGAGGFLRVDYGTVSVPGRGRLAADVGENFELRLYDPVSLIYRPEQPGVGSIPLPDFEIVGVRQEFLVKQWWDANSNHHVPNRYGHGLTYLFNRPPRKSLEAHPEAFRVVSEFAGKDVLGNDVSGVTDKVGESVFIQDSERVAHVLYSGSISPLMKIEDGVTPLLDHDHLLDESLILDRGGEPLSQDVPEIVLERVPMHTGGLVGGRVLRGTGAGVAGAKVELIRQREFIVKEGTVIKYDPTAETVTDADGRYFFDFVENPIGMPVRQTVLIRATVPAGSDPVTEPETVEEVGTIIRQNNAMANVNIALLGRGAISGHLKYADSQEPVFRGRVEAASTLFNELKSANVDTDGAFRFEAVPVGPITLTGRDPEGRAVYATVEVAQSGSEVEVELRLPRPPPPGLGTVRGRVLIFRGGQDYPAPGAHVGVWVGGNLFGLTTAEEDGSFVFPGIPAGQVTLQAADFGVSRTAVLQDQILPVGGTVYATLRIPETLPKTIVGKVEVLDLATGTRSPLVGAPVFISGPGNYSRTDSAGRYVISGVPTQANGESPYQLKAIDLERGRDATVVLPVLVEATPDPVIAPTLTIETGGEQAGGVRGRVLDPFGVPAGGVDLVLYPLREGITTAADGTFFFPDVRVGTYEVVAHYGDGLEPGREGYFGKTAAHVSFPGHQPFVTVSMVGAGTVRLRTRTSTSTGILTPIYYRPTYYSSAEKNITLRGNYFDSTTDPNGLLELKLPVGDYEIVAYNPFHGTKRIAGRVDSAGQLIEHDIVFEDAGKVAGQVVGPDGVTPVPFAEVVMRTGAFLPQTQEADALGRFEFFLVPKGPVVLEARGQDGAVERVGSTLTFITLGGQEVEVSVTLKKQGTVLGRVVETVGGQKLPVAFAQYAVHENSFPFRQFPEDGTYYVADAQGAYEVSHLFAGDVTVVARHPVQPDRTAQVRAALVTDWQRLDMPDIDLGGSLAVGRIEILVRDPVTGAPVPDAQVQLSNGEMTVAEADGRAIFEALRLGNYSVYVFYAPSGRSGRASNLVLTYGGQVFTKTVDLDQRGEVRGTVWDSPALQTPVPGAVVELRASTAGGSVVALATTSTDASNLGRFEFLGIPESTFQLTAAQQTSPRRGALSASLTATSPLVDVNIVLEPLRNVHLRLYEKLTGGTQPVDTAANLFSVRTRQGSFGGFSGYDYTRLEPEADGLYFFPDLLLERPATFDARELTGDLRSAFASLPRLTTQAVLPGTGTLADPFRLTLNAKGTVRVTVKTQTGDPVHGATVRLGGGSLATGADGSATFVAVPAGNQTATATNPVTSQGGYGFGFLEFDDQTLEIPITLAAAVSAAGTVHQPAPGDRLIFDPSTLPPHEGAVVELVDSSGRRQVQLTDGAGRYRFDALRTGNYSIVARSYNGEWEISSSGNLQGADGEVVELAPLVLDASPPRLIAISPASGATGVSVAATAEIIFNEPLANHVLPSGANSSYFSFKLGNAAVAGVWSYHVNNQGQQVVRFDPSENLENFSLYSISIRGGGTFGVVDRQNRPLTTAAFVGSSFRTKDSVGPTINATLPRLDRPVDPEVALRFDFSERLVATAEMLDGDLFEDAATMEAQRLDGSWVALPIVQYLTRNDFSLQVERFYGVGLPPEEDSGRRRLTLGRLADALGNPMAEVVYLFRLYDDNPPIFVELPLPANAPDGNLYQGTSYSLVPTLDGLDDLAPANPGGDIDRVEYYFNDPDQPGVAPQLAGTVTSHPFAFGFVGAYVGTGAPRPFPMWARAYDTSKNASATRFVDLRVLPNATPTAGTVLLAPADGVLYPGDSAVATAQGFSDVDAAQLNLTLKIRREDSGAVLATKSEVRSRPAAGWPAAPALSLTALLPDAIPEGTVLLAISEVRDNQGALATATSAPLPVADDQVPPQLSGALVGDANAVPRPSFQLGESIQVEIRAVDGESKVKSVKVSFEPAELLGAAPTTLVRFDNSDRFRLSAPQRLTSYLAAAAQAKAIFEAEDFGGNVARGEVAFEVRPAADPAPPRVHWTSPFAGAAWPAAYTSLSGPEGVSLLLRIAASDQSVNGAGGVVAGEVLRLEVKTALRQADGSFALEADWRTAEKIAGGEPGRSEYQLLWRVPNGLPAGAEIPFAARAWDAGGNLVEETASLTAVPARKVYEGVTTALVADDPMADPATPENAPVFLLGGSALSLYPRTDGGLRQLPALYLYSGGRRDSAGKLVVEPTRLTTPEITSLSSAVLYYPLQLEIGEILGIAGGAAIDLSGRGLLGGRTGSGLVEATLPGIRGASPGAAGSHGGFGLPGGDRYAFTSSPPPGEVYDDLRRPHLPGGGGRSATTQPGGAGGGVARISAAGATIRLEGELLAKAPDSLTIAPVPRGAGGAIYLEAGLLTGWGRIDASGGSTGSDSAGGGGGRVAVYYREVDSDFEWHRQVVAWGGGDSLGVNPGRAGAGTVYREQLPISGPSTGMGILQVVNGELGGGSILRLVMPTPIPGVGEGKIFAVDAAGSSLVLEVPSVFGDVAGERVVVAAAGADLGTFDILSSEELAAPDAAEGRRIRLRLTVMPDVLEPLASRLAGGEALDFRGLARLLSIEAGGAARLFAEGDLELGPQAALNDRAFIASEPASIVALRADSGIRLAPSFPDEISAVRPGQAVAAPDWTLSHAFSLHEVSVGWHPSGPSFTKVLRTWPATYVSTTAGNVAGLAVPFDAAPGSFEYRVEGTDLLGRRRQFIRRYEVLANQAPTLAITGGPTTIRRGTGGQFDLQLGDFEGLAAAGCDTGAEGVQVVGPNPRTVSGTAASIQWHIGVPVSVTASSVELVFWVEDLAGVRTETRRTFQVTTGSPPTGSLVTVPAGISLIEAGHGFEIRVEVDDPDRDLAQVRITGSGPISHGYLDFVPSQGVGQQFRDFQIYVDQEAQPGESIEFTGVVEDVNHNVTPLGPLVVTVAADATRPTIHYEIWGENYTAGPPWYAGQVLEVWIRAWDNAGLATLEGSFLGHDFFEAAEPGNSFLEHFFTYQVPIGLAAPFEAVLTAKAVDQAGLETLVTSEPHTFLPDLPPTFSLMSVPAAEVEPGGQVVLYVVAQDDRGLEDAHFRIQGGGLAFERTIDFQGPSEALSADGSELRLIRKEGWENPTEAELELRFRVLPGAAAGETITIEVGVDDLAGNLSEQSRILTVVSAPPLLPRARLYLQPAAAGDRYVGGQTLTVVATARTDAGPTPLELSAAPPTPGGQASGDGFLETRLELPVVSAATTIELSATATGAGGLAAGASRIITVLPELEPNAPWVRFDCPTGGALLPTGQTFGFAISAGGARGLAGLALTEVGSGAVLASWDPAAATTFAATTAVELGAAAGTRIFEAMVTDTSGATATVRIEIEMAAAVALDPAGPNDWAALESQIAVLEGGTLSLEAPRRFRGLILLPGATITHPPFTGGEAVDLTVDETLYLACGAKIDVAGKGHQDGPAANRGSHIGAAGGAALGTTYGSVVEPREPGASGSKPFGQPASAGGGVVRLKAGRLVVDGTIDAAGKPAGFYSASAGGSIWLTSQGAVSGAGSISARGSSADGGGSAGGGAIAIEGELAADLAARCDVAGGTSSLYQAGPGSLYLRRPGEALGRLVVRGTPQPANQVQLPYFELPTFRDTPGAECRLYEPTLPDSQGVLQATLHNLVDWADRIWIEVLHEAGGGSKGYYLAERIAGTAFRLHPAAGQEAAVIEAGDQFRPYHQLGSLEVAGDLEFYSDTALLPLDSVVIDGRVDTEVPLLAESVELRSGALLGPPHYGNVHETFRLLLSAADVIAEPGARLEAGGRGWFGSGTTPAAGGSHLGVGGGADRTTFGNPEYPRSAGQGGRGSGLGRGGGAVELASEVVYLPGGTSVRADGSAGGAGGSVLIQAASHLHLAGPVTARGGNGYLGGGGGAVALHHGGLSGRLDLVDAYGGRASSPANGGGAGTVFVHDLAEPAGDLIVDNGDAAVPLPTILPRLGHANVDYLRPEASLECELCGGPLLPLLLQHPGTVMCGFVEDYWRIEGGDWRSDLELTSSAIGRSIEISVKDPQTQLPGPPERRRIGAADGHCAGLEVDYSLPPLPAGVDYWQAIYSFANLRVKNAAFEVLDPLRLPGQFEIEGKASLAKMELESLVLRPGATLTSMAPESASTASAPLELTIAGELRLEPGAKIDVSGQGLAGAYSGNTGALQQAGATHIGVGGSIQIQYEGRAYGGVYHPREPGAGRGTRGGGVVALRAGELVLEGADSAILANASAGAANIPGAAGGSVMIEAESLSGLGRIEARGGDSITAGYGAGGGGAVSVFYGTADLALLERIDSRGGQHPALPGGPGSIYLYQQGESIRGDLVLENGGVAGTAELPEAIGFGADEGSAGNLAVTSFQPEFLYSWYRVEREGQPSPGFVRAEEFGAVFEDPWYGTRAEVILGYEPGLEFDVQPYDFFNGLYLFDVLTTGAGVSERSTEQILTTQRVIKSMPRPGVPAPAAAAASSQPVRIEKSDRPGVFRIEVPPHAFGGLAYRAVHLLGGDLRVSAPYDPATGAELLWPGLPGDSLRLELVSPEGSPKSLSIDLPTLPGEPASVHFSQQER